MKIRRRTFWFRLTAWGFGPVGRPLGGVLSGVRSAHEKTVLATRRNTGVWGEWWS
jgi:hypothetical protein